MNVASQKNLQQMIDQMQKDQPIGMITSKYVESALRKHPIATERKKLTKRRSISRHSRKIEVSVIDTSASFTN